MENNHLAYLKIKNFKKFESLEVKDIGQFNLIVGDNNVGKTCLLEALLFDEDPQQLLNNFYIGLTKRGLKFQIEKITKEINGVSTTETIYPKGNYFEDYIFGKFKDYIGFKTNKKNHSIFITKDDDLYRDGEEKIEVMFSFKSLNTSIPINELQNQLICIYDDKSEGVPYIYWIYNYDTTIINFPLISFNDTPLETETRNIYENLKTKREKQTLVDILKIISPKIVDIELRQNFGDLKSVFLISYEDKDEFVPLNYLGDGFRRIFYIILKTISLRGKRIMIDEIDTGIHYSKMKDFWVNIIKVCKEMGVQLFATTHSRGCMEALVDASKENNQTDVRLIKLLENKDKTIKAITYPYNEFEYLIESETETR